VPTGPERVEITVPALFPFDELLLPHAAVTSAAASSSASRTSTGVLTSMEFLTVIVLLSGAATGIIAMCCPALPITDEEAFWFAAP